MYGKPGNSVENLNGTVHPGGNFPEKINTLPGITVFPFLPKRPKFSVPFVSLNPGFISRESEKFTGILQMVQLNPVPVFGAQKNTSAI